MIVYGCVSGYLTERSGYLIPGLDRNLDDSDLLMLTKAERIAEGYNRILDLAPPGVPVVLLHDDTDLGEGARDAIVAALRTADVVGVVGASGIRKLAWWSGTLKSGRVLQQKGELDFGGFGEVEAVDGLIMCLSPPATKLRFDELYDGFHGYDVDFCFQARAAGLKVATADIPVTHQTRGGIRVKSEFDRADKRWRSKWLL